jgi:asparagine synthase (glutamine-hydrolysing)
VRYCRFLWISNDQLLKDISTKLKHRGPDGEGYYFSEKVSLLNRRLAIIDRKGGDQPILMKTVR